MAKTCSCWLKICVLQNHRPPTGHRQLATNTATGCSLPIDHRQVLHQPNDHRPPTHRQVLRLLSKCKIESLSMGLSQLTEDLKCFGHLQVIRKNSSLFYFVFCPNDKLIWGFKSFTDMLQLVFSDDEISKKVREVTVYKRFADPIERCFWMVNNTSILLFL